MSTFASENGKPYVPAPVEAQQATLTENEQKLVARLFGDPTFFPIEFRRWIKDYIENSGIKITASQITGLGGTGGGATTPTNLPAGIILPYAGGEIGTDCLPCNGAAVSRTDYANLFKAVGETWGKGDGTSTFNVPDFRDRSLYGAGSVVGVGNTDGKALGQRGGPSHHHDLSGSTSAAGTHNHPASASGNTGGASVGNNFGIPYGSAAAGSGATSVGYGGNHTHGLSISVSIGTVGNHSHTFSGSTSGAADRDRASFAGIFYAITTGR
jgi:microcystin-dependent protein